MKNISFLQGICTYVAVSFMSVTWGFYIDITTLCLYQILYEVWRSFEDVTSRIKSPLSVTKSHKGYRNITDDCTRWLYVANGVNLAKTEFWTRMGRSQGRKQKEKPKPWKPGVQLVQKGSVLLLPWTKALNLTLQDWRLAQMVDVLSCGSVSREARTTSWARRCHLFEYDSTTSLSATVRPFEHVNMTSLRTAVRPPRPWRHNFLEHDGTTSLSMTIWLL